MRKSSVRVILPSVIPYNGTASRPSNPNCRHLRLLPDVVCAAQKREQNLQDVGISVTAFGRDQIRSLGFTEATDVAAMTPNVSFLSLHPANASFNIRGVSQNDFADHFEPPVALYVDDEYV